MVGAGVAPSAVPKELRDRLKGLASNSGVVRFAVVDELVTETNHVATGATVGFRYMKAAELVDSVTNRGKACYLMLLVKEHTWSLITYLPDDTTPREKMLYSATQAALVEAWPQEVADRVTASAASHITDLEAAYTTPGPQPLSVREINLEHADKMETEARKELAGLRLQQGRAGSGGYHVVKVPLSQAAKDKMDSFQTKQLDWIRFRLSDGAKSIDVVETQTSVPAGRLPVDAKEPGFYLARVDGSVCFLYVCPSESQQRHRMAYSTTKPAMRDAIVAQGIAIKKTLEYSSPDEVTVSTVRQDMNYRAPRDVVPSVSATAKALNSQGTTFGVELKKTGLSPARSNGPSSSSLLHKSPNMQAPHPIYKLGIKSNLNGTRKGIVIPPPGAYGC